MSIVSYLPAAASEILHTSQFKAPRRGLFWYLHWGSAQQAGQRWASPVSVLRQRRAHSLHWAQGVTSTERAVVIFKEKKKGGKQKGRQ